MKIAFAMILLVLVAGCINLEEQLQPPSEQKPAQQATPTQVQQVATLPTTPQATAAPLDVKISFVELPQSAKANDKVVVTWKIESNQQKETSHTSVHYGDKSVSGDLSTDVTPANSGYASLTPEYASSVHKIPNEFSTVVVLENKGIIYARAHVIVDGKNYWSAERSIKVE